MGGCIIRIGEDIRDELNQVKFLLGFHSINEVVSFLLEKNKEIKRGDAE